MTPRRYALFGLTVASDIAIPWAPELTDAVADDVSIRLGSIDPDGDDGLHFDVSGVARYRIAGGRDITVAPQPGASEADLRLYLLGSALGVLLHQRGLLVLHANAIVLNGAAILFMGPSGAGKSTLAGWFASRGYEVLTDDVCALEISAGGVPKVLPGLTRLRLDEQAMRSFSMEDEEGIACPSSGKREVGFSRGPLTGPAGLRGCYLLADAPPGEALSVRPLRNIDAVEMLMANTYRGFAVQRLGGSAGHMSVCVRVAAAAPCFEVRRGKDWAKFDIVAEALLAHAAGTAPSPAFDC